MTLLFEFDSGVYTPPNNDIVNFNFNDNNQLIIQNIKLGLTLNQYFATVISQRIKTKLNLNNNLIKLFNISSTIDLNLDVLNKIYKTIPGYGETFILFNEPEEIKEMSLSFDQLGQPIVFYRINTSDLYLYWFDPIEEKYVKVFLTSGVNPTASFDFPQDTSQPFSDALLFYVRNNTIYMRIQRERFEIEYAYVIPEPSVSIRDAGLRVDNRFQVSYNYLATGYNPPASTPVNALLYPYYEIEEGTLLITNTAIDVINNPFSIGFTIKDVGNTSNQVLFGSNNVELLSCFCVFDSTANTLLLTIKRGYTEYTRLITGVTTLNGVWEFQFNGYNKEVVIIKDTVTICNDRFSLPQSNKPPIADITFGGCLYGSGYDHPDTYPFKGLMYNCWVDAGGSRLDWEVVTKSQGTQPSTPSGNDMTILNHKLQNWILTK